MSEAPVTHDLGKKTEEAHKKMIFNCRFRVEAKEFTVSVNELGTVRMTEWSSKISTAICMGRFGALWMVNMVNKLRAADKTNDFTAKFSESSRAFLVQRCANSRGRYLVIAQYGERRRRGVVMVPEGVNGRGWASMSHVFQRVVDFFVAGDKVKHRTNELERRQGITYAGVTANIQAPQNAKHRGLWNKENELIEKSDTCFSISKAVRDRIKSLREELDELIRLVDDGVAVGARKSYCNKCGVNLEECLIRGTNVANMESQEMTSNKSYSKEELQKPMGES